MSTFIKILLTLLLVEIFIFIIVRLSRNSFPWVITEQDEIPMLNQKALKKFFDYSYDYKLGWVRKPNTTGLEQGQQGQIEFHIDDKGSRCGGLFNSQPRVAAFGDSYVFCRQVNDDETWEALLSRKVGYGILNFGVGNYGVDQALIRYKESALPETVQVAILGFVPETICRIQSYWKHYLEFGNTFAFKPRFILKSGNLLTLIENPIKEFDDYNKLEELLPNIRSLDLFYSRKFRPLQFRPPYTACLLRNLIRHSKLISLVIFREFCRHIGILKPWIESLPFSFIMKENIRNAHKLYSDKDSTDLLRAILLEFKSLAISRGHLPLIVVMPQLLDLKLVKYGEASYKNFYRKLSSEMSIIDLTSELPMESLDSLYINDQYGGHFSVTGNNFVSEKIANWLNRNLH